MKKLFRKLHLWFSVPFGIFITLICFSGSMLVFEKEITEMCNHDLYFVDEVKQTPLPLDELMTSVAATLPDSVAITSVTISDDASRNYQVSLSKPRRASLYVDQYTGQVKGRSQRMPFFDTMFHLHRWLMGSSDGVGKLLVGISTLVLVIILITGLLMWLTNRNKPLVKSLKISFTKGWPRFWHDLHVAGGIYATILLLAVALTGLTWSFKWYRTGFYAAFGVETSAEGSHGGGAQRTETRNAQNGEAAMAERRDERGSRDRQEQAAEGENVRHSRRDNAEAENTGRHSRRGQSEGREAAHDNVRDNSDRNDANRHGHGQSEGSARLHSPYAHWQQICDRLAQENPGYRQISISDGQASVVPANRTSMRAADKFDFDKRTGEITGSKPYDSTDRAAKVRSGVYTVHVGSWGGLVTRILTFLSALLGATLPLTGYYLWIRRLVKRRQHKSDKA
ncbi:MAG: PepSY domain-containing protein [Alistipes sp.]|nr:PepSY domain-containing protein [Alistipes sp.]